MSRRVRTKLWLVDGASSEEMLAEHDRVVLTAGVSDSHLKAGDTVTIVHVYRSDAAFDVEFHALDGTTAAVATIPSSFVRPVVCGNAVVAVEGRVDEPFGDLVSTWRTGGFAPCITRA